MVLVEKKFKPLRNHKIGILPGELYLEGQYLHKPRSRHPNEKKFKVLDHTVYISPGENFETFVEFDDNLTMGNECYSKYLNLSFCINTFSLD